MNINTKQYLALNNITYARKDVLVKQGIAYQRLWNFFQLSSCFPAAPFIIHHITRPVVYLIQRLRDKLHRTGIKIKFLFSKFEMKPGFELFPFIDTISAKH